jgi:energy-coupling factor transporter ATP-binding protein EcfA2
MKLLELEVSEFRGIRHLTLTPNGRNVLIVGPNGTGKSAIVDAIDFLLTGAISRLQGEGSRGLSLTKHGRNLGGHLESSWVRGRFLMPESGSTVELRRGLGRPGELAVDPGLDTEICEVLGLARQGQHLLTRRVLLQFILSEGKPRAELIQKLLNAEDLEEVRSSLVKTQSTLEGDLASAETSIRTAEADLAACAGIPAFTHDAFVKATNELRLTLGGSPLAEPVPDDLKVGLSPPLLKGSIAAATLAVESGSTRSLRGLLDGSALVRAEEDDAALRLRLETLRGSPAALRSLRVEELLRTGLELLDDESICPLCETPWEPVKLRAHLQHRLEIATDAKRVRVTIEEVVGPLLVRVDRALADLRSLLEASNDGPLSPFQPNLSSWKDRLSKLRSLLESPIARYPDPDWSSALVARLGAPDDFERILAAIEAEAKRVGPTIPPPLLAWDSLTKLTEFWRKRAAAKTAALKDRAACALCVKVLTRFETTRVAKLTSLYAEVASRFTSLYAELHPEESATFRASLSQEKAAAVLQVGFHGMVDVPPSALHSEGHQDSMGLCMFLALSERIAQGKLGFAVLDDVVMSVDADHRRSVAKLIAGLDGARQFLLTTHDPVWAHQLRTLGVVASSDTSVIRGWSLSGGPVIQLEPDFWQEIESDMNAGRMSVAAGILRRNLEALFAESCAALEGKVIYRREGQWDLGDFLPAAYSRWKDLVAEGLRAATRRGDAVAEERLAKLSADGVRLLGGAQVEQWGINAAVHYNNWANLTPADFRPIVNSFRDLSSLLRCQRCSSMVGVTRAGATKTSVACRCGAVSWPLC